MEEINGSVLYGVTVLTHTVIIILIISGFFFQILSCSYSAHPVKMKFKSVFHRMNCIRMGKWKDHLWKP
jgi:hypothetical protein